MNSEVQLFITFAGIIGAGLSAYVGVRVAIAEVKTQQRNIDDRLAKTERRIDRLEDKYFK